ncbi:hypothetical protein GMDG_06361 [Pseudogymnoascus destructans 20631-21]|uniref:Uncharacterized protein n=1 Tax=Pseudogymnoascus destructans (strain ATCC MYA-4855 / 20631-21) TaxID=658429 RepID=L8FTB9_PSED2|nr:hypothetical protein GMDG_06361 [Pseudogymnoascus destructans 20631-21]
MAPQPLPEELLGRICIYLCPHRQNPNDLPNPDEPCVRASKATLARLCRVSKRMLAIAQPILYHYYATGNIIGPLNPMVSDYPTADDKLPSFLRTIIHQPILAIHIRTLQLQSKSTSKTTTLNPHLRNGSSTPPSRAQKTRIAIHPWLRELAIILTPRTSHLMLGHSPLLPRTYIEPSSRLLPACTSLSFRSGVKGYNLAMMPPLLRMAPNLTSLQATDILGWHSEGLVDNAPLSLQKVRRLVAEELRMNEFSVMVRCDVSSHYEYLMPKSQHQTIQSLQEFYQLEELVMDQWAFLYHDNGSRGTKGLVTLLPASIQIVHLSVGPCCQSFYRILLLHQDGKPKYPTCWRRVVPRLRERISSFPFQPSTRLRYDYFIPAPYMELNHRYLSRERLASIDGVTATFSTPLYIQQSTGKLTKANKHGYYDPESPY